MADKDHYLVLGVSPSASSEEIKNVYRQLSKKYHPDANQDNLEEAEAKMKVITAAYQVLSHPDKRRDYDTQPLFKPKTPKGFSAKNADWQALAKMKKDPPKKSFMTKLKEMLGIGGGIKRDPSKAQAFFSMGMGMTAQKEFFGDAKIEFSKAVEADPLFFEANFNLGLMCYKCGEYENARNALTNALKIDPNDFSSKKILEMITPE